MHDIIIFIGNIRLAWHVVCIERLEMQSIFYSESYKRRDHLRQLGLDWYIILKTASKYEAQSGAPGHCVILGYEEGEGYCYDKYVGAECSEEGA
jgi:hypothetical protein